jgi:hypothetical protein
MEIAGISFSLFSHAVRDFHDPAVFGEPSASIV